jgi:hypothetical protein
VAPTRRLSPICRRNPTRSGVIFIPSSVTGVVQFGQRYHKEKHEGGDQWVSSSGWRNSRDFLSRIPSVPTMVVAAATTTGKGEHRIGSVVLYFGAPEYSTTITRLRWATPTENKAVASQ